VITLPERGSEWRPLWAFTVIMAFTNTTWWSWAVWAAVAVLVVVGFAQAHKGVLRGTAEALWIGFGTLGVALLGTIHMLTWDTSSAWRFALGAGFVIAAGLLLVSASLGRTGARDVT